MRSFGLVGLGVMGRNLALNARDHGLRVVGFDQDAGVRAAFVAADAGEVVTGLAELVARLRAPRVVLLLVPAGAAVEQGLTALSPLLSTGDVVVDAGNSHYADTARRQMALSAMGLQLVGLGVSGGSEGARRGPALMIGGEPSAVAAVRELLEPLAARVDGRACFGWFGPSAAGHFVKMAHNGIEYADMQMIGEAYALLRHAGGLAPAAIAELFARWSSGPLGSFLMEVSSRVLAAIDVDSGQPLVDVIVDSAGQKGTGHWAVSAAMELGVAVPSIAAAVDARNQSAARALRAASEKRAHPRQAASPTLLADVHDALLAGRLSAFAQGLALLDAARCAHGWSLDLAEAAACWRGGCIIRGRLLDELSASLAADASRPDALTAAPLAARMASADAGWRRAMSAALSAAVPVPALQAALAYRDALGCERLWADLIQAQRDCFGAHGFERIDRPGIHHGPWGTTE